MVGIGSNEASELIRIPKGRKRAVNQTNNLAEFDFRGCAPQPVAALRAPNAFHDACVLELQQINSRNFSGKSLSMAMSRILTVSVPYRRPRVIIACSA